MKSLVIFDLNGTICDTSHRDWMVAKDKDGRYIQPPNWNAYYAACVEDKPNPAAIAVALALYRDEYELWFFSGNAEKVSPLTYQWLAHHDLDGVFSRGQFRAEGDFAPDYVRKMRWYDAMPGSDRARLLLVFDDRERTVKAWRARGVTCFQTAAGGF